MSDDAEIVIFVHGTANADIADTGEKWWQSGSAFGRAFSEALGGQRIRVGRPFHWSGANSETGRRAAASALLDQLRSRDASGQSYHLIGHSHGGSVIWHALVESGLDGRRLEGLRSWTTVGTPFLTFRQIIPSIWRFIALASLTMVLVWLLVSDSPQDLFAAVRQLWQSQAYLPLAQVGFLFSTLLLLAVWASARIGQPLVRIYRDRRVQRAEGRAKDWYGDGWLGLWHPLDEPINGLAGTVGEAPRIAPNVAAEKILSYIPFVGAVIRDALRRAADEFAWKQISDRAQGDDRGGYRLTQVGRAPALLASGLQTLPSDLANDLANSADARSVDSIRRLRVLLQAAYDEQGSQVIFEKVASIVSFQEIIHTSYFDHPGIAALLAAHVTQKSALPDQSQISASPPAPVTAAQFTPALDKRKSSTTWRWARPLQNLEAVAAVGMLIGPGLLLGFAAASSYEAVIAPKTTRYQIDQIAAAMQRPARTSVGNSPVDGEVIVRLDKLGRMSDPVGVLARIGDESARTSGAIPLARWLGERGQWSDLEKLGLVPAAIRGRNTEVRSAQVRAYGLVAASASRVVPSSDVLNAFERDLLDAYAVVIGADEPLQIDDRELGRALVHLAQFDRIERLLNTRNDPKRSTEPYRYPQLQRCRFLAGVVLGAIEVGSSAYGETLPDNCASEVPPKDFFYTRANAYLNHAPQLLASKIGKQELAARSYKELIRDFEGLIKEYEQDLTFPAGFVDGPKYRQLTERLHEIGRHLTIRQKLSRVTTSADTFGDFVNGLNGALNRAGRTENLGFHIKFPIAVLLRYGLDSPEHHRSPPTRKALTELYEALFSDIASEADSYCKSRSSTGINMLAEAGDIARRTGADQPIEDMLGGIMDALQNSGENSYVQAQSWLCLSEATSRLLPDAAAPSPKEAATRAGLLRIRNNALNESFSLIQTGQEGLVLSAPAVQFVRAAQDTDERRMLVALDTAERLVELESMNETRSGLLLELCRALIQRNDLARARAIAESAPLRIDTMTAYKEILDRIIATRPISLFGETRRGS